MHAAVYKIKALITKAIFRLRAPPIRGVRPRGRLAQSRRGVRGAQATPSSQYVMLFTVKAETLPDSICVWGEGVGG